MNRRQLSIAVTALALYCFPLPHAIAEDQQRLRLGTFRTEVTLPLGDILYDEVLTKVEHPLLAKGVILDDGRQRCVLCAVDWCVLRNAAHEMFRAKVAAAAGTDPSRVAVHCVHQHTAPTFDASAELLLAKQEPPIVHRNLKSIGEITDRLATAVRDCGENLTPFDRIGTGQARVERVAAIRRVFTPEGKLLTRWSACRDPKLRAMPEGEIDPMMRTVTLAFGEKPLVRLHYYATHPQSFYRDGRASWDFPGIARERLESDEDVFQIYFTGCSGDVTAGKYNDGTPQARAELADRLFAGMKASAVATQFTAVDDFDWAVAPVPLKARSTGSYDIASFQTKLADAAASRASRIQAASRIACYERLQQPIELSRLRIGPVQILHLPGEPMIAYQHFAQSCDSQGFVAVAGYGLGTPGYVCTEQAFEEGGYEPSASAIVPESERLLKQEIRRLIAGK